MSLSESQKDQVTSEVRGKASEAKDGDGVRKIREAVAAAIKEELRLFGSAGLVTQEALDAEVAGIVQKELHPRGSDLVVPHPGDNLTRLLIKIRRGEAGFAQLEKFLHHDNGSSSQNKA